MDVCVIGMGHQTMIDLMKTEKLADVNGIQYISNENVYETPLRSPSSINDVPVLDTLGMLANFPDNKVNRATVATKTGCSHLCTFCEGEITHQLSLSYSKLSKDDQYRSLAKVLGDILSYYNRGATSIHFSDPNFTSSNPHLKLLAEAIKNHSEIGPLVKTGKLSFTASGRIDDFDRGDDHLKATIKHLNDIGVKTLSVGMESVVHIKEKGGRSKNYGPEEFMGKVRATLRMLFREGIETRVLSIIGFPGETFQEAKQTVDFLIELLENNSLYGATADIRSIHTYEIPAHNLSAKFILDNPGFPNYGWMDLPPEVMLHTMNLGNVFSIPNATFEKHTFVNLAILGYRFPEELGNKLYGNSNITFNQILSLLERVLIATRGKHALGAVAEGFKKDELSKFLLTYSDK